MNKDFSSDEMIKKIGRTVLQTYHIGRCHCGEVEFVVHLPNGIEDPRRCDCSICRRRGAIAAYVALSELEITKGIDKLTLYQFNTRTAKHYFCSICGIYTHHQTRANPELYGFNLACLDGVNPFELGDVRVNDGINHISDREA